MLTSRFDKVSLMVLFLYGCDVAPDEAQTSLDTAEVESPTCGQALTTENGIGLNGIGLNGIGLNGIGLNGIGLNGIGLNGIGLNGIGLNGIGLNGIGLNGVVWNGVVWNGVVWNGVVWNGVVWNGVVWNGVVWNGIGLNGDSAGGANQGAQLGTGSQSGAPAGETLTSVALVRGELVATTSLGRTFRGSELVGLPLPYFVGESHRVAKIVDARPSPTTADVTLYALEIDGKNICGDNGQGMFVPGVWDTTGARHDSVPAGPGAIDTSFSCLSGALAKCVTAGYLPWDGKADLHQACTRMIRADYCGDGVSHTSNGTLIDMFDGAGIQTTANDPALTFEAGWGANGATCVSEPRLVRADARGNVQVPSCWASKPRCDSWAQAQSTGALVGNKSAHTAVACTVSSGSAGPAAGPR